MHGIAAAGWFGPLRSGRTRFRERGFEVGSVLIEPLQPGGHPLLGQLLAGLQNWVCEWGLRVYGGTNVGWGGDMAACLLGGLGRERALEASYSWAFI